MVELRDTPSKTQLEAPFPIRDRVVEEKETCEVYEEDVEDESPESLDSLVDDVKSEEGGFDDLLDDLEDTLGDVVGEIEGQEDDGSQLDEMAELKEREEELTEFLKTIKKKNYYEIFGMAPNSFDFKKFKKQYFELTRKFSPENFLMSSGDVLANAEDALSRLSTAYNTLSNVVSKEKYDEMLETKTRAAGIPGAKDHDKMQAEVALQSGMAFLEMRDWDGAEKALSEAMSMVPDNAEVIAHYAYALYNRNRKSKAVQTRVQELLSQALKIKPKCAPAFAYRGTFLIDEEKFSLAEADFKKALSINPRYRFALKGINKIENIKAEEKKGFFARFKK